MSHEALTPELEANLDIITDSFRQQFLRFQRGKTAKTLARHREEEDAQAAVRHDAFVGLSPTELRVYSVSYGIHEFYRSIVENRPARGLEAEIHKTLVARNGEPANQGRFRVPADVLQRSMHTTPGAKGGFLTATPAMSFADLLRANSVVFTLGAAHVTNQVGNVLVTTQTAGAVTTWLGAPGTSATESEPGFGQISGSPKTVMTYTQMSAQLNRQVSPAAEYFLLAGFAKDLGVALDAAVINGTGGAQPLGVLNTPAVQTQSGTTLNAGVLTMKQKSAEAHANDAQISFLSTPAVRALLEGREKTAGGGKPVWDADKVADRRALVTTNVPTATMVCGDWAGVTVIEWNALEIEINPYQDFTRGLMGVRALWMVDCIVTTPSSFVVASSIT